MTVLEDALENKFAELDISAENKDSIQAYLSLLRHKDIDTYLHSIRVGLLGVDMAKYLNLDPKAMFYSGTLHDVGKLLSETNILRKKEGFDEKDMSKMRKHPLDSYDLLKGIHAFSAEIALRHHKYQENGYPQILPESNLKLTDDKLQMIETYAKLLSIADFYDAATTRINNKTDEIKKLSRCEVKNLILKTHLDQSELIEQLYQNNILGNNKYYT
jgi:HD-GYP domain-containing protein (c-di-GMP phosphodiesterase class II)